MKKHKQKPDQLYNYLKNDLEESFDVLVFEDRSYDSENSLRLELWDNFASDVFDAIYGSLRHDNEEA